MRNNTTKNCNDTDWWINKWARFADKGQYPSADTKFQVRFGCKKEAEWWSDESSMSSQCGCRNTESVMTLHSQRYFAMEGIPEEQNGTTIAEASIKIAAFYLTDRTGEIKAKKTKARSPVLNKAARSPLRNMKCHIYKRRLDCQRWIYKRKNGLPCKPQL